MRISVFVLSTFSKIFFILLRGVFGFYSRGILLLRFMFLRYFFTRCGRVIGMSYVLFRILSQDLDIMSPRIFASGAIIGLVPSAWSKCLLLFSINSLTIFTLSVVVTIFLFHHQWLLELVLRPSYNLVAFWRKMIASFKCFWYFLSILVVLSFWMWWYCFQL